MSDAKPAFTVGRIPIHGRLILAPMAGYADVPHRAVCQAQGSAMQYTEFVAAEMILAGDRYTWNLMARRKRERPFTIQLFSNDPRKLLAAAQKVESLEPDVIDVNMGCSTRKVSGRGAGVGLMRRPELVAETFRLLTHHLTIPITGKIRLGWEENRNYLEIARIMEDNGAALVAIHPRTKEQKYSGAADWEAIAAVKQAVQIPVIGNGDVTSPADAERMMAETGCDGVMIGRGAIGSPWIFSGRAAVPTAERFAIIRRHLAEMTAFYGEAEGVVLFRKYLKRYLEPFPAVAPLLKQALVCGEQNRLADLLALAETHLTEAHLTADR